MRTRNFKINVSVNGKSYNFYMQAGLECLMDIEENADFFITDYDDCITIGNCEMEFEFQYGENYEVDWDNCTKVVLWDGDAITDVIDEGITTKVTNTIKRQPTRH